MSKLRDSIRNITGTRRGGIGFAPISDPPNTSQLLIIAEVTDINTTRSALEAGAGALLYTGNPTTIKEVITASESIPVGCRLDAATTDQVSILANAGADFFTLTSDGADAATLLERNLGHILLLDLAENEENLRMLASLGLDAILLTDALGPLTVEGQLRLRRMVTLARAPMILPIPTELPTTSTLEVWRDAGAAAILASAGNDDAITSLIRASNDLPPPSTRDDYRPDPILPTLEGDVPQDDELT